MEVDSVTGSDVFTNIAFPMVFTAKVAAISLMLHAVFGLLIGYYLGRKGSPIRSVVDTLVTLPLVFPPVALGFLLLLILGKAGPIGRFVTGVFGVEIIFNLWGVVIAAFVAGLPLIVKPVQAAVQSTTISLIEASYTLGKSEAETFVFVVIPSIKKSVAGGLSLAFGRSLGEVGLTLMLGGNIVGRTNTLSLEIYNSVFTGEFERAGILAAILGCISVLILLLLKRLSAV
ncbi:molybdate ABC transporter permease subunit [Desulfomonile tiedjei]|uniref:ABC-type molybdate transport system, permease component n=1 Tax=Desulfomonile tiedjei (strain ATCC 49306 / DSM 6799 / DCB-1) TaxID=706587 RepID=I4C4S5_DESTA|nr:ABC transporter permease subunit [Desulfomonile tiedjei]AFM24566.1 ABC-type molybdate transport system, permease component [Desulfomonile tiedjei DSM 6799]